MQMNQIEIRSLLGCAEQGAGDVPRPACALGSRRCVRLVPQSRTELAGTTSPAGTAARPNFTAVQGGNGLDVPFTKLPKVPCTALGYQLAMCKMRGVEQVQQPWGTKGRKIWLNINERTSSL